jgi:hypothetical protein
MNRTSRTTAALAALALVPALAPAAHAAPPRMYHTVSAESASFDSLQVEGCLQTELFVGATTGHWAGRHGPATKQAGPTGVLVRITDICQEAPEGFGTAAAGPGGAVVLQVEAQGMIGLTTDQHLTSATVTGTLDGTDQDGAPVTVGVDVTWTAVGPLEHTTYSIHDGFPDGNATSTGNEWSRAATGTATVTLDGQALWGFDDDARIERTKGHCIEIPKGAPSDAEFFPCFGFPG